MSVEQVEVIVEEPSMEAVLRALLPKLLGATPFTIYPHQCKDQLLARLPQRLCGYRKWLPPGWRIVIVVDRDDDACQALKTRLEQIAQEAGLRSKTAAGGTQSCQVINRVVVEELEAWYFGDWDAVRTAYPRVPARVPQMQGFRNPDQIAGGTWEAFERVLRKAGYFKGGLRKIEAARTISPHMNLDKNTAHSFNVFCAAMRELAQL